MTKPANKRRGEVALPGFGEGATLRFDLDALERLEGLYGDEDWVSKIVTDLAKPSIKIVRSCVECGLTGGDAVAEDGAVNFDGLGPGGTDIVKVVDAIYDALFLSLFGLTYEEKKEQEEARYIAEIKKKVQLMTDHPEMVAFLSSTQSAKLDTDPVSDPANSGI